MIRESPMLASISLIIIVIYKFSSHHISADSTTSLDLQTPSSYVTFYHLQPSDLHDAGTPHGRNLIRWVAGRQSPAENLKF